MTQYTVRGDAPIPSWLHAYTRALDAYQGAGRDNDPAGRLGSGRSEAAFDEMNAEAPHACVDQGPREFEYSAEHPDGIDVGPKAGLDKVDRGHFEIKTFRIGNKHMTINARQLQGYAEADGVAICFFEENNRILEVPFLGMVPAHSLWSYCRDNLVPEDNKKNRSNKFYRIYRDDLSQVAGWEPDPAALRQLRKHHRDANCPTCFLYTPRPVSDWYKMVIKHNPGIWD